MNKRQLLVELYERNMNFLVLFRSEYKNYLDQAGYWNEPAFGDSRITHEQYYNELIRISNIEYCENQYNAIKTIEIQDSFLDQYIQGINQQYVNLSLIYEELKKRQAGLLNNE